jgi:3-oxoacyl-[acyl-carrier protein] reductase
MTNFSNQPLEAQLAVVTGAGRGIGAAVAQKLAHLGAHVILAGRSRQSLALTSEAIQRTGGSAQVAECDVTDLQSVEALAEMVGNSSSSLKILVNNAGIGAFRSPLHLLPPVEWDRVINTNLRGVYYCIRALAPLMIRAGRGDIINISSIAGKCPLPNGAVYAASKWGLNGLSYSVAEELRSQNVRVAVICPGSTDTELSPHEGKDASKMFQPEDVAHAVEMLVTQPPRSFASEIVLRPTQKP